MFRTLLHVRVLIAAAIALAIAQVSLGQQSNQPWCHEIAVIGAVRNPQRIEAQPGIRLFGLLAKVGGPSERAGSTIQVLHTRCNNSETGGRDTYKLADVLLGRAGANPVVSVGDIVSLPEADSVFVVGNVLVSRSLILRRSITVREAVVMAGGVAKDSNQVLVRISRRPAVGQRREDIVINFRAILDGRGQDVPLQAWDIVEVSDERGRFHWPMASPPIWDPPLRAGKENSC